MSLISVKLDRKEERDDKWRKVSKVTNQKHDRKIMLLLVIYDIRKWFKMMLAARIVKRLLLLVVAGVPHKQI